MLSKNDKFPQNANTVYSELLKTDLLHINTICKISTTSQFFNITQILCYENLFNNI